MKKKKTFYKFKMLNVYSYIKCKNEIFNIYNMIVNKAISENWYSNCIIMNIIFHDALLKKGIYSEIKIGFLNNDDLKYSIWYTWLECNGVQYDITQTVTREIFPEFKNFEFSKTDNPKYERLDMDNDKEIELLEIKMKLINTFLNNPDMFWNKSNFDKIKERVNYHELIHFKNFVLKNIRV